MNKITHFDPWHDRHEINMEPGKPSTAVPLLP